MRALPSPTLKTGTFFEDSPIAVEKWSPAVWLIGTCKSGISNYEISSDLGISQKSALRAAYRTRFALHKDMLSGRVEVDETFIGGKARNMTLKNKHVASPGRSEYDKVLVMGILERGGKVRTKVVSNRERSVCKAKLKSTSKRVRRCSAMRCSPTRG